MIRDKNGRFVKNHPPINQSGIAKWRVKVKGKPLKDRAGNWTSKPNYRTLHKRVRRWKGIPRKCLFCGKTKGVLDWANIDHSYTSDLDMYIPLCRKCHVNFDIEYNHES